MSNPNLLLSASPASPASPAGIMFPSDHKPMASDEDETMASDEDETMASNEDETMASDEDDTSSVDKIPSCLPYSSIAEPRSCIFWDVVDFPLPNGVDPVSIYQRIKTFLESMGPVIDEFSIILYVDGKDNIMRYDAFKKAAGFIILSREGDSYPRGAFMLMDIVLWAMENPATYFEPLNLMVISKNIEEQPDFLNALEALEDRYYNILLALPELRLPSRKLHTVDFQWLSASLLGVVEPVDQSVTFHHLPKSRNTTVGSDGLPSLFEHFEFVMVHVFCNKSTDCKYVRTHLSSKGYSCPLYFRTYTSFAVAPAPLKVEDDCEDDCLFEEIFVDEKAEVTRMLLDVLFWAMNNHDIPRILMIIAEQSTKWDRVIKGLRGSGFFVHFGTSAEVASSSFGNLDPVKYFKTKLLVKKHGRNLRTGRRRFKYNDVFVFCLVEDGWPYNPQQFVGNVRQTLIDKGYSRFTSMTAYAYKSKISDAVVREYNEAGVMVRLIPEYYGESEELGRKIMLSAEILDKATRCLFRRSNFLVISKPTKLDALWRRLLQCVELRGSKLIFEVPDYMYTFGTFLWSANDQLAGINPLLN